VHRCSDRFSIKLRSGLFYIRAIGWIFLQKVRPVRTVQNYRKYGAERNLMLPSAASPSGKTIVVEIPVAKYSQNI